MVFGNSGKRFHALFFSIIKLLLYRVTEAFQGPIILVFSQPVDHGPFNCFNSIERALSSLKIVAAEAEESKYLVPCVG